MQGIYIESCESTSLLVREHAARGAPHGFWISSRTQTAGRGRWGRQWQSQPGNLLISIILRPESGEHWTWIPMLGALSVLELLQEHWKECWNTLPLTIKWPNDLWLGGKKLGGLLCESVSGAGQDTYLVLGLGLNVAYAPGGLDQETACLAEVLGPEIGGPGVDAALEWLRPSVAAAIAGDVRRLGREGPGFVEKAFWRHAHFGVGSKVSWTGNGVSTGRVHSLGPHGELRVESGGAVVPLYAEEIRGLR